MWILGRVIYYYSDSGAYDVVDVDDSRVLKLPETQVIALDAANLDNTRRLLKNDEVLAVYPDTSTFYRAILAQAPRRANVLFASVEPTALVQFDGEDLDKSKSCLQYFMVYGCALCSVLTNSATLYLYLYLYCILLY